MLTGSQLLSRRSLLLSIGVLCLVTLFGCDDGLPKRVRVSGKVLLDGQPVTHGFVQVLPKGNRASYSKIQSDGTFVLSCFGINDGCVLGTHEVLVEGREQINMMKSRWHAPMRFANASSSGLEVTISEPTDDLVIDLQSGGKKPFQPFVVDLSRSRGGSPESVDEGF